MRMESNSHILQLTPESKRLDQGHREDQGHSANENRVIPPLGSWRSLH